MKILLITILCFAFISCKKENEVKKENPSNGIVKNNESFRFKNFNKHE